MKDRKRHVADVASELFIEKGIQQTSIQDIIDRANISKGTFYNYFSTKNDCIAEFLDELWHDISQLRNDLQIGKDQADRHVLIEQIATLLRFYEKRNMNQLLEVIFSSKEADLKELVLQHRMYEFDWMAERFVDIYGEEIQPHAFDIAILFMGMLQNILFMMRISHHTRPFEETVRVLLSYLDLIIPKMVENKDGLLNEEAIDFLRSKMDKKVVSLEVITQLADELDKQIVFTMEQRDLFEIIVSEIKRERIRKSIILPLLKPLIQAFDQSPSKQQIKEFTQLVWYYVKH